MPICHPNRTIVTIGAKYGKLTIVQDLGARLSNGQRRTFVRAICECGNQYEGMLGLIKSGGVQSCGCYRRDLAKEWGKSRMTTHGLSDHPLLRVWDGIIQRCTNPNANGYKNYGGRGVSICNEWRNDFKMFHDWAIENGWQKGLQIDRINNDDGYYPENCRCVTRLVNTRNKRTNVNITFNGETKCITDWAKSIGISYAALKVRVFKNKWPLEVALTKPKCTRHADRVKVS